ncbi:hypothetical protein AB0F91_39580 [Amycolatopsis sp. NPDC023774]|uniref:hypothetical protein n=1 Tax=Amycolatopsis sp. NPDC023774 TaxID=3155015 RepID=UPI0033F3BF9E
MTAEHPLPIDSAAEALLAKINARRWSVSDLSAQQAWAAFLDFAALRFDIPNEPDADGLLYQFGVYHFTGEPAFHLDPTRQLALREEQYVQVHLDIRFALDPSLVALGRHTEWWFSEDDTVHAGVDDAAQPRGRRGPDLARRARAGRPPPAVERAPRADPGRPAAGPVQLHRRVRTHHVRHRLAAPPGKPNWLHGVFCRHVLGHVRRHTGGAGGQQQDKTA